MCGWSIIVTCNSYYICLINRNHYVDGKSLTHNGVSPKKGYYSLYRYLYDLDDINDICICDYYSSQNSMVM